MKNASMAMWLMTILIAAPAVAEMNQGNPGYLFDTRGNVVKNSYGECWRTRWWEPQYAIEECDPEYFAKAEPPMEPAKPEVMTVRVTLDVATYFAFDRDALRPDAKERLQELTRQVDDFSRLDAVKITGHADPIGPAEYNRGLSLRRAESVRAFLVGHGVPNSIIATEGKGESEPVVTCEGKRGRELIRCYEPNRRVEVDLTGVMRKKVE